MKLNVYALLCAALLLFIATPVSAQNLEPGGPGPYQVDLVSDKGDLIGTVGVEKVRRELFFDLTINEGIRISGIQLWVGPDAYHELTGIPVKTKGKPLFGDFPFKYKPYAVESYGVVLDIKDDLKFSWKGGPNYGPFIWSFMLHGDYQGLDNMGNWVDVSSFTAKGLESLDFIAFTDPDSKDVNKYWNTPYKMANYQRGQFIDSPVGGLNYHGPSKQGVTTVDSDDGTGGYLYYPGENVEFSIGSVSLGSVLASKRVSPLDFFPSAEISDPSVVGIAQTLQTLDEDSAALKGDGKIVLTPEAVGCFEAASGGSVNWTSTDENFLADLEEILVQTVTNCNSTHLTTLAVVDAAEAQDNLYTGLSASGIFRKNISKTEDFGETKQKLEVMPVYFPGMRSNDSLSICCIDETDDGIDDCDVEFCDDPLTDIIELCEGDPGVPYEEWRLDGDPLAEECDPRDDADDNGTADGDQGTCVITQIECRTLAKPILATYMAKVDIFDDQVKEEFWPGRFSWDLFTAISRDDGTTWKRMNVSRMADMSSFDLEATDDSPDLDLDGVKDEEPFPGTVGTPYLKVNDNKILTVWESKFCKSGNPRYSINLCENDDGLGNGVGGVYTGTFDSVTETYDCAEYCRGNPDEETEVCEPDYPGDDDYFVTDIWGVRGQQQSVDYNEVDDVDTLGIGEIPYSCLWAARGVIVSEKELAAGTFDSLTLDDPLQCIGLDEPYDCCTGPGTGTDCEIREAMLGDIIWFKPERLTSGRRDVYIPMLGSARGAGFAIAWQEDPSGLRPGKGKGPGEGWSGAITNHKSDMWYSFISYDDFNIVDADFDSRGPGGGSDADPSGEGFLDKPGLGRPKAKVPFSLPVRLTDNDMVNTHTLKVVPSTDCPFDNSEVCFPEVVTDENGNNPLFVPLDPEVIAEGFCPVGHVPVEGDGCCDPDDHQGDLDCEDLKGLYGNLNGTKRYAYLARSIDELDNATGLYMPGGDGTPDYQYYVDNDGNLDLCDLSGDNTYFDLMPGTSEHERWFGFTNSAGVDKLVCVSSDGRLLDGDVYASRPMLQLQPYTKSDGTKSAWALFAYEESKGLGHSLAAEAHLDTDNPVDSIVAPEVDDKGQEKPIKQDIGKNMMYHSFDFAQPDLVAPGHIANLPALCGGLYPTFCDDPKTPDVIETNDQNPTCSCEAGQPVPLYFDRWVETETTSEDGEVSVTGEWLPQVGLFLQYRYEIARRARFLMQSPGKMGDSKTLGALIYKQGQEGQGRPADAYIRRFVKSGTGNPYKFENMECTTYLDETFDLPGCPTDGVKGYNCNVWGEAYGDRLCGGIFDSNGDDVEGGYLRRDHINMTSADVDLAVGVGPEDDTPDDPTDDVYSRNKVLLWSQHERNLGDESYGFVDAEGNACDVLNGEVCPGMYSNVRSHRGFIRGDFFAVAYALSPNWAAGRNGNDRYNFYVRKSFDGGQTWTTTPAALGGEGVYVCPEYRTDPYRPDPDGSGNQVPLVLEEAASGVCGEYDPEAVPDGELPPLPVGVAMKHYLDSMGTSTDGVAAQFIGAGAFEPARNVSEIKSNKESSGDPRLGTTPPVIPLDGTNPLLPMVKCTDETGDTCDFEEDFYVNNKFFVAWGTVDNEKSTGSSGVKAESGPLDIYYTRSENYGDTFVKIPWVVGGENSNEGYDETVWRYDFVAKGDPEEQGECQLRATSDGSKAYVIWHSTISAEEDPDEVYTRYYPWKPSESTENDLWFRRLIFWPVVEETTP